MIERYLGPALQWLCQKDVSASALMTETLPAKEDHCQFGNIQVRGIYTFKGKSSSYWSESQFSHFLAGCLWQVIYLFNSLICKLRRIPTAVGCCEIKNKVCLALKCCRTLSSFILSTLSLLLVFQMQSLVLQFETRTGLKNPKIPLCKLETAFVWQPTGLYVVHMPYF